MLKLTRGQEVEGREVSVSHTVELLLCREPSNVRALLDDGVSKTCSFERMADRRDRREPFPIDWQETGKGLLQDAEATRGHIGGREDDPMRDPRDVAEGGLIIAEMVEHHDNHGEVKTVCLEREAVAVALHTLERAFRAGDPEHGLRRIKGHDAIRRREERCKSAGPRSEVQHALPIPQASDFDESAKPELAVHGLVRSNAIVGRGMPRIVNGHKTCKR